MNVTPCLMTKSFVSSPKQHACMIYMSYQTFYHPHENNHFLDKVSRWMVMIWGWIHFKTQSNSNIREIDQNLLLKVMKSKSTNAFKKYLRLLWIITFQPIVHIRSNMRDWFWYGNPWNACTGGEFTSCVYIWIIFMVVNR